MFNKKVAVKPDFFNNLPSLIRQEKTVKSEATDEERMLFGLSQTAGWALLLQDIERLLDEMDQMNEKAIMNGATYEEIGKNTLVISLAKGVIHRIVHKVTDAKEACERSTEQSVVGGAST